MTRAPLWDAGSHPIIYGDGQRAREGAWGPPFVAEYAIVACSLRLALVSLLSSLRWQG